MEFLETEEYKKDLKKLSKRFRTLLGDIETLKKVLEVYPDEKPPISVKVSGLGIEANVIKVRRIACRAMKHKGSNTGFRLIYCYKKLSREIIFIELYFKGDKENEDRARILKWCV